MNTARFCSSPIVPSRFIGLALRNCSVLLPGISRATAPSVGMRPGPMALSRMPWRPHSMASDWVIAQMPALDMIDGTTKGAPLTTPVLTMDSTEPPVPASIQRRPTACVR